MYSRILALLDGSKFGEQVLPYVSVLGKGFDAKVELVSVVESPFNLLADPSYSAYLDEVANNLRTEAETYLEGVKGPLSGSGLDVSATVFEGDLISYVENEGRKDPSTLIAMCSHGRSGHTRWWLGSTADKVIHTIANPVLVVGAQAEEVPVEKAGLTTCIVPLDGSAHSEQVIPHVASMANALGLEVVLTRVIPELDSHFWEILPGGAEDDREGRAGRYLAEVATKLRGSGVSEVATRVLHGHAAGALADFARETPGSIVAMATHGLGTSEIYRWTVGSVTQRVVGSSKNPVLVVRVG